MSACDSRGARWRCNSSHTGEFAGIPATGRAVRVPYSVVYDLRGDQISAVRIYFPMSLLIDQISG